MPATQALNNDTLHPVNLVVEPARGNRRIEVLAQIMLPPHT